MNKKYIADLTHAVTELTSRPIRHDEDLYLLVYKFFNSYEDGLVEKLTEMIKDWETEVPDDSTLYTLGLRRAIDVIQDNPPL